MNNSIQELSKAIQPVFRGIDPTDQEDLMQDTLFDVCKSGVFNKAMAITIARRRRADYFRRRARQPQFVSFDSPIRSSDDDDLTLAEVIADTRARSEPLLPVDLPAKIRAIGEKILQGDRLGNSDKCALYRFRKQYAR